MSAVLRPEEHLARLSGLLRRQIGPAVAEPFPRTQAFMAAVVLDKLARQLATEADRTAADRRDVAALRADLDPAGLPGPVAEAVTALDPDGPVDPVDPAGPAAPAAGAAAPLDPGDSTDEALCRLVSALYAVRGELGDARFELLLGRVRQTLRARLDRRLEYAA